jgi:hypothetical protein
MRLARGSGWLALLLACASQTVRAQDTIAIRHLLPLDISRVQPFHRSYDMITHAGDSSWVIGQRDLTLTDTTYAGTPAWLLVETRTGVVPAAESLYLARDLRPIHWASTLGQARLGLEFVGDSILGATTSPLGRRSIVAPSKPDVIVSVGMLELLLPLLPLEQRDTDSVSVLQVDAATTSISTAGLAVEDQAFDIVPAAWLATLSIDSAKTLVLVRKDTREPFLMSISLPRHVGTWLTYERRPDAAVAPPLPPP